MAEVKKSTPSRKKKNLTVAAVPNKDKKNQAGWKLKEEVLMVVLFMLAVFLFISVKNFHGVPEDRQFIGVIGTYLMHSLQLVFGKATVGVSIFLLLWSIHIGVIKKIWSVRMWGLSWLLISVMIALSTYDIPIGINAWEAGLKGMGGGAVGGGLAYILMRLVGQLGTMILLVLFILLSLIMILEMPISEIALIIWKAAQRMRDNLSKIMYYEEEVTVSGVETAAAKSEPVIITPPGENVPELEVLPVPTKPEIIVPAKVKPVDPKVLNANDSPEIIFLGKEDPFEYRKPALDLLTELGGERIIDKKNIKDSISVLEDTFASFGVSVKVNQVSCGPAVTRYELTPAPGVKISRIISLTDDLQLNLAAPGIRIEAPIPGKAAIGIEVPNSNISSVGLRNLLSSAQFRKLNSPLAVALGEDIADR